jgi:hypothetical protein
VWDAPDIPEREHFRGRPSGSVMSLVGAHAEHIKLLRSLADNRVFDTPTQDSGFGIHLPGLATADLATGKVVFIMYWSAKGRWEGADYRLAID